MGKKVLIISNNCLSEHTSNGRTLLNLLGSFQKEELYQLFIANEIPQALYCEEFYRVTDKDVVRSYGKCRAVFSLFYGGAEKEKSGGSVVTHSKRRKKTAFTSWIRDLMWRCAVWSKRGIVRWAKQKQADAVLLQAGDNALLCDLARGVAKKCGLPLIVYNTEDYYFKDYDYMKKKSGMGLGYRLYHSFFRHAFCKTMKESSAYVYNCEGLKKLYDGEFQTDGKVVYTATGFSAVEMVQENGMISYAGNLGCGRHKSLLKIGAALQKIDSSLYLDVYGSTNDKVVLEELKNGKGIRYHGFVPYSTVCDVIKASRLLVHAESFDPYYERDTKYAFSTKLADYCASNVPMLICAPPGNESYEYMKSGECAFILSDVAEAENTLREALFNAKKRNTFRINALKLAKDNHCYETNGKRFKEIITEVVEKNGVRTESK